jgi:putative transposase
MGYTSVTHGREPVFAHESACKILQSSFHEAHRHYPFRLAALVIPPDHWHALVRPGVREARIREESISSASSRQVVIEQVVGAVKRVVLRELQIKGTIWQNRFLDHRIRDEDDFLHHLEYIRLKPVKHGYVAQPDQYVWCFIHSKPFG